MHEGGQTNLAQKERKFTSDLLKYFIHGLLYAIIGTLATIVFAVISLISTIVVGAVAGFAGEFVGYIVLTVFVLFLLILVFFVAGLINTSLSRSFWRANPPKGLKSYTGHGAALVLILTIFGLPNMAIDYFFPNLDFITFLIIAIPRIVIYAIIDGYLGRWIAYGFSNFPVASKTRNVKDGISGTCPQCGVDTIVTMKDDVNSRVVTCHGCGNPFEIQWSEE